MSTEFTSDNDEILIEKGIPMPRRDHGNAKYPWLRMEVGDSFLWSGPANSVHNNAAAASRNGRKFKARKTDAGYRVWRVE